MNPNSASGADIERMATAVYNGIEMQNLQDDCGKPFWFLQAWLTLLTHGKFSFSTAKKTRDGKTFTGDKKSTSLSLESDAELVLDVATEVLEEAPVFSIAKKRPIGLKRAKDVKQQQHQEQTFKNIRIAKQSAEAQ